MCQNQLQTKNKYKLHARNPAIGQPHIVPVFGLKLARHIWICLLCLRSLKMFLPDFQAERPYVHCIFYAYAVSGPSVAIIMSESVYVRICIHTCTDFTFHFGVRCAPVVMLCTLLLYSIVDADGSPPASPRVEVASGLVRQITSRRAGGSARIVDGASKLATGERCQKKYSWRARN